MAGLCRDAWIFDAEGNARMDIDPFKKELPLYRCMLVRILLVLFLVYNDITNLNYRLLQNIL